MLHHTQPVFAASVPDWMTHPRSDGNIRISRNFSLAFIFSALLHLLLLLVVVKEKLLDHEGQPAQPSTIVVNIAHAPAKPVTPPATPVPPPPSEPPQPTVKKSPPPKVLKLPRPMTVPKSSTTIPLPKTEPQPQPPVAATPQPATPPASKALDPSQFPDMASYVKAMREQRHAPSQEETTEETKPVKAPPSGTNGIFQVPRMDEHTAILIFHGWKGEYSYSRQETYQVDAKLGEDIRLAVIRKMIEIIRRYYDGDFNWMSPTRGRMVLSARLEDNDRLEKFLMNDFYGPMALQY
jgi:hypothetical protein